MSQMESREVAHLVERAAQRADLERRTSDPGRRRTPPVITVSREFGAQGARIARRVAAQLAVPCWDQELVHEVSKNTATPEIVLRDLDEHRRSMVIELLGVLFARSKVTSTEYHRELVRVISAIGQRGAAVIVGRGAQFVLPSSMALRVRVVAPKQTRVEGLARRKGIGQREALGMINQMDEERAAFMRTHYDQEISAADHYDLVINSDRFDVQQMVGLVLNGMQLAGYDIPDKVMQVA